MSSILNEDNIPHWQADARLIKESAMAQRIYEQLAVLNWGKTHLGLTPESAYTQAYDYAHYWYAQEATQKETTNGDV